MDIYFYFVNRFPKWMWMQMTLVCLIVGTGIQHTDGKVCVKREEIGNRPGNLYTCEDPVLTQCCEKNRTFTCCEHYWKHVMTDQLWLLVVVVIIALLMILTVSWCCGQNEFFKAPTAKEAATNFRDKFRRVFEKFRCGKKVIGSDLTAKPNYTIMETFSQSADPQQDLV